MIISLDCLGVKFGSISKITTESIVTEQVTFKTVKWWEKGVKNVREKHKK